MGVLNWMKHNMICWTAARTSLSSLKSGSVAFGLHVLIDGVLKWSSNRNAHLTLSISRCSCILFIHSNAIYGLECHFVALSYWWCWEGCMFFLSTPTQPAPAPLFKLYSLQVSPFLSFGTFSSLLKCSLVFPSCLIPSPLNWQTKYCNCWCCVF